MRKILFAMFVCLTTVSLAHFGSKGPYGGGKITCTTQGGGLVYFGTENGGVFENTNTSLVAWRARPVGLKSGKIAALAHTGTTLFAATPDSGLFRFTGYVGSDRYWEKVNVGVTTLTTTALAAIDATSLIAGTSNGKLFKTTDNGANWSEITGLSFAGSKVTFITKASNRLILIIENKGVFYSDDNGSTWSGLNDSNTANISETTSISYNGTTDELMVKNHNGLFLLASASTVTSASYSSVTSGLLLNTDIRYIHTNATNWFLATNNGIYSSLTGAVNWSTINTGLSNNDVNVVTVYNSSLIAGINKDGFVKSDVNTVSWVTMNVSYNNQTTYSMATSGDQVIVAATEKGVFVSKNLATTYSSANNGLTDYLHVNDLTFFGTKLFAVTENNGVFISADTGAVWTPFNNGLTVMNVRKVVASNNYIYIFDASGSIYQSNGTGTWVNIMENLEPGLEDVSFGFFGSTIVLGIHGGGVHTRPEAGGVWTDVSNNIGSDHVTAVTALGTKVYAGTHANGVFVADVADFNWTACAPLSISHTTLMGLNGSEVQAMATFGGYVFASYRGGLLATNDHGTTWVQGGNQFNLPSYTAVNKISFVTTRVFVTTENNCLYSNSLSEVAINVAITYPTYPSCYNTCDGTLTAVGTGGTAPYTYSWSSGQTTSSITGVCEGTYYVTITDALNNTHMDSVLVEGPDAVTPTVNITANVTSICPGVEVTFTPEFENEGTTPSVEWFVNGTSVSTDAVYNSDQLSDADVITCELTSSETCITAATVTSNEVEMEVATELTPSVTFVSSTGNSSVCEGLDVTFIANPENGGTSPIYQWFVNGIEQNETGATFTINSLQDQDNVFCSLISSLECATEDTVEAVTMSITVNPIPDTPILTVNGQILSSSVATGNQWYLNGGLIDGATNQLFNVTENGNYSVTVTENGCTSASSAVVAYSTLSLDELQAEQISVYPNPSEGAFVVSTSNSLIDHVEIIDGVGHLVLFVNGANTTSVHVNGQFNAGLYLLKVYSSKGMAIERMTVK